MYRFILIFLSLVTVLFANPKEIGMTFPLSDSYEMEIFKAIGVPYEVNSVYGYQQMLKEQGFKIEHQEVRREMIFFNTTHDLKHWIRSHVPKEEYVDLFLKEMERKGWEESVEGKIGFPMKKLYVTLTKSN